MNALVFLLLLSAVAIAACGGDSSMDQQAQSAVMGSNPITAPDGSMTTPTPMMR
jgi:ABC-type Fe3+-hydroxamate transport system substrate-binding protein